MNPSKIGQEGLSPFFIACQKGNLRIMQLLVKRKAAIDCTDVQRRTPLMVAVIGRHVEAVKYLLKLYKERKLERVITARHDGCGNVLDSAIGHLEFCREFEDGTKPTETGQWRSIVSALIQTELFDGSMVSITLHKKQNIYTQFHCSTISTFDFD